jgi:hypothetical protein
MAIPLSYELLKNGNKNKKRIITMMVSLILTFSGNALLILAVAFMGIELKLLFCNRLNDFIKGLFLVIVLIVCFEIALYKIPYFQSTIARLTEGEILGNTSSRYSGYIRVLRGYEVYMKFGFFEKIFGIGIGNYTSYSESNFLSVLTSKTSILTSYLNGIQYYLISTGVIGLFLYIKSIVRNAFNSSIFIKIVILQFLALSAIAGLYKGCIWIIFMLVIFNGFNEDMSWEV